MVSMIVSTRLLDIDHLFGYGCTLQTGEIGHIHFDTAEIIGDIFFDTLQPRNGLKSRIVFQKKIGRLYQNIYIAIEGCIPSGEAAKEAYFIYSLFLERWLL